MDLSRTRVVLRERAVVDVLDLAVRFLVDHGRLFSKTALVVLPPFVVTSIALAHSLGWITAWVFSVFAATFAGAPFTLLASRLVFEDDVRLTAAIVDTIRQAPRLLALRVMTFVVGGLGALLVLYPGLWVFTVTIFVVEVMLLERAAIGATLRRSLRLVRRESGEATLLLLLIGALHLVAVVAADAGGRTFVSALLESRAPEPLWSEGGSLLGLLGFWLFVPYAATARFFVYLDVRTRSEGWDIQTSFVALAARSLERQADVRSAA